MQHIHILHNPNAGDEEQPASELRSKFETAGFITSYASVKSDDWKAFPLEIDLIVIAGGDGTVRKVVKKFLKDEGTGIVPIAIIPMGTANNLAKTLGSPALPEYVIALIQAQKIRPFDVGLIHGLLDVQFFIEGFGLGVFPQLLYNIENNALQGPNEIQAARLRMVEIILHFEARFCKITADGSDYSGKYLMVEVMNTRSIGANLFLAPEAETSDGQFDLVLVEENQRDLLAEWIKNENSDAPFKSIRAKNLIIAWDGLLMHTDDKLISVRNPVQLHISCHQNLLKFIAK